MWCFFCVGDFVVVAVGFVIFIDIVLYMLALFVYSSNLFLKQLR